MRSLLLLIMLMAIPSLVLADDATKPDPPTLTVAGNGTVSVQPDTAFVSLGVETAGKSLVEAQHQNSAAMQKVIDRLRELKIDKERIQTTAFTVTPQYRPPGKRNPDLPVPLPEIIGYTVTNTVSVEVRDPDKVAAVIDGALAAGANRFHGLNWALQDEQRQRLAALQIAAATAREKATALSQSLKVKLVRVLRVSEAGHVVRPAPYMGRMVATMEAAGGEVPVSSGELKVEATVTLVYEIDRE